MVFPFFCFYAGVTMEKGKQPKLPLLSPTPPPFYCKCEKFFDTDGTVQYLFCNSNFHAKLCPRPNSTYCLTLFVTDCYVEALTPPTLVSLPEFASLRIISHFEVSCRETISVCVQLHYGTILSQFTTQHCNSRYKTQVRPQNGQ